MVSLPDTMVVFNHDNSEIFQSRTAEYDSKGHLTRLTRHNGAQNAVWEFSYDNYGNMVWAKLPANANSQRLEFTYSYDPVVHTYPMTVTNTSLGFTSTAEYEYLNGKPTYTTDINGNIMQYDYDALGRTTKIIAPYELSNANPYTIKMEYHPHNYSDLDIFHNNSNPYSYAITEHYDCQHPGNPIRTTLITDGLGRLLQTKKDAEIGGQEVSLVTGKVVYDCFGRTLKQFHPFTEPLGTEEVYNDSVTSGTETVTKYDLMDRQTRVTIPGNRTTTFGYGFDIHSGHKYFSTTTTDPMNNTVTLLKGSLGQQIKTIAPMNTITTFDYSPLAQLLRSTDPDGLATYYQYDMLGRLMTRTHPDAGIDRYEYDPAGNMVKHINGNGQTIEYRYDYNHLTDIIYPDYPANNVHYTYGETGAVDNRAGRIAFQEDASGWQIFSYGKLGEVTENIRTFALPNESKPYTFKMVYNYDSFNRIQQMTYPDGEVVGYFYNSGGMLDSIGGTKMGQAYPYVNHIAYDKFELKDSVLYGNGTLTTYEYDTLQRLVHLTSQTGTATAEPMQILDYDFDDVGNIGKIINSAGILANGMGGTYNSDYTYDSLYRLKTSAGNWNGNPNTNFSLSMEYTSNGRIRLKSLDNVQTVKNNSYDNLLDYKRTYSYYSGSNKLENITDDNSPTQDFRWDGNGNLVSHSNISKNCLRQYCWDEDNRMLGAADCEYASFYQYDANGERTYKLTGVNVQQGINEDIQNYSFFDQPTLYASPYVVCTPKGYTKHYYAESERVASKIGNGCLSDICSSINPNGSFDEHDDKTTNPYLFDCKSSNDYFAEKQQLNMDHLDKVLECLHSKAEVKQDILNPLYNLKNCALGREKECYWYHPDHLGSSSWITFSDGEAVQHLHYLPWGEDFVDQRSTSWSARHSFSAKERDAETGLSYFGARYYSSDLSIWLSVDPMSGKYPSLSPYVYCANNPVRLVDPNGEEVWIVGDAAAAALEQLQNQTTLVLSLDEHGKLCYSGEAESDIDKLLVDAIKDEDISVNIISTKDNVVHSAYGGAYGGNSYEDGKVCTDQYVTPSILADFDKSVGDSKPGLTMVHELAESYYGGVLALEYGQGSAFGQGEGSTYLEAHWCANQIAIGNKGPIITRTSLRPNQRYNPLFPISPCNSPIEVGEFEIQTGWTRTTNRYGL